MQKKKGCTQNVNSSGELLLSCVFSKFSKMHVHFCSENLKTLKSLKA